MAPDRSELDGFDPGGRRAVSKAEVEARELGHDRIGTEHLLLGLVAEGSGAARALAAAGLSLPAARHKVREVTPTGRGDVPPGPLPASARAARALNRAIRFSHTRRATAVTTEHILLGVLDVEGTAGQVLRGLGIDVDQLRAALDPQPAAGDEGEEGSEGSAPREAAAEEPSRAARCPSCGASLLDGGLTSRVVPTSGAAARPAVIFACAACRVVIGATQA